MPEELSQDQVEELFGLFAAKDQGELDATQEEIGDEMGLARSTVAKYRRIYNQEREKLQEQEGEATLDDPMEVLVEMLEDTPGVGESKQSWAIKLLERNPAMLRNPHELMRVLKEGLKLKDLPAQMILQAVMEAQNQSQGTNFYGPMAGGGQGGGGMMMMPGPGGQQQPMMQTPYGPQPVPPWMMQQNQQGNQDQGVTREDLQQMMKQQARAMGEMVKDALESNQEGQPDPDQIYEEYEEVVTDDEGNVRVDPNGNPVTVWRRRPIQSQQNDTDDFLERLVKMKQVGLIGDNQSNSLDDRLRRFEERLVDALERRQEGDQPPGAVQEMQDEFADMKAKIEAERARREEAEKYSQALTEAEQQMREMEIKLAQRTEGMPADAQILSEGMDKTEKLAETVLKNTNQRMARIESLLAKLAQPQMQGEPVAMGEQELADLHQRQQQVDQQEQAQQPQQTPPQAGTVPQGHPSPGPEEAGWASEEAEEDEDIIRSPTPPESTPAANGDDDDSSYEEAAEGFIVDEDEEAPSKPTTDATGADPSEGDSVPLDESEEATDAEEEEPAEPSSEDTPSETAEA